MKKVFVDGSAGTTGLRIVQRLTQRQDLVLLTLPEAQRKDTDCRREMLNAADFVFLCLPDAAAIEAVSLLENPDTVVFDTSTAHRTQPGWVYGFPELSPLQKQALLTSNRIAVPGCHASGFIALVKPLVDKGFLSPEALLYCHSLTGYSGGGKKMIAEYEEEARSPLLDAPRAYGLTCSHKHLPEMCVMTGLTHAPLFCPVVADFYSGMLVTVPVFAKDLLQGDAAAVKALYAETYGEGLVQYQEASEGGFLSAAGLTGKDTMELSVLGNEEQLLLTARYDNLGKGASGAALECLNYKLGLNPATGLTI